VATARRHTEPPTPKNAPSPVRHSSPGDDGSDPVAPSRTIFQSNTERGTPAEVAASCGHTRTQAPGNTVGAAPAAILHSSICLPHSPAKSDPVAPGRTTFPSNSKITAVVDGATSCRHPEPAGQPVSNPTNSYLNMLLAASRAKVLPVQPPIAPLPNWNEEAVVV
jgi:hypothetical protein